MHFNDHMSGKKVTERRCKLSTIVANMNEYLEQFSTLGRIDASLAARLCYAAQDDGGWKFVAEVKQVAQGGGRLDGSHHVVSFLALLAFVLVYCCSWYHSYSLCTSYS